MSTFVKGGAATAPFGRNEFLRSWQDVKTESYTVAAATVPARTVVGSTRPQKILQPGTVMAAITSGADAGKIGPFQAGVTDGRQTAANIVGLDLTFLPWQLLERDVEVSVVYQATAVQAWCIELIANGTEAPLSNTTADLCRGGKKLQLNFS